MVSKTLNANPKLRTELEAALKSTDAARKDTARDIIDIALNAGLNEVFKLIHSWLEDGHRAKTSPRFARLWTAWPRWVWLRNGSRRCARNSNRDASKSHRLPTPAPPKSSWPPFSEFKLSGVHPPVRELPPVKVLCRSPRWSSRRPTRESLLKEVKMNLMKIRGISWGAGEASWKLAEENLRQQLAALHDLKQPMFTLFEEDEDARGDVEKRSRLRLAASGRVAEEDRGQGMSWSSPGGALRSGRGCALPAPGN